jgi:mannan endo-1,4-beta-mannosidase
MNVPIHMAVLGSKKNGGAAVSADDERTGRHRQAPPSRRPSAPRRRRWVKLGTIIGVAGIAVGIVLGFTAQGLKGPARPGSSQNGSNALPTTPDSYVGLYSEGVPSSYAGVTAFAKTTGVKPALVSYYSGWQEPFQESFAVHAAEDGSVPLVQMDPGGISIGSIASGKYDAYLTAYADAVRGYHRPVILSFGHEMNGYWYSWGYQNTPAAVFVAAWRHIVTLFRGQGARNVTWLWTVNVIHKRARVPSPRPWWPGDSYVNWVGIDGYYNNASLTFASLFGPTIASVRGLTRDPILIAETAVSPAAGQPAKIADLFAGIRLYNLLGFLWFDSVKVFDWRLSSRASISAFRRGAKTYRGSVS